MTTYVLAEGCKQSTSEISKKGLGMPPVRLLVLAMAARRHEGRVLAGARALELERAASVAGGDVCVVCAV